MATKVTTPEHHSPWDTAIARREVWVDGVQIGTLMLNPRSQWLAATMYGQDQEVASEWHGVDLLEREHAGGC